MGREYAYLSFLKEKKVDYIYHSKRKLIEFACIYCHRNTYMCSQTSEWHCVNCKREGNIITLIEYAKINTFNSLYTPKKEERSILLLMDLLMKRYPEEGHLIKVNEKIVNLINYYKKRDVERLPE